MKLNIAVVFGGKSTEHEVSVISALQAIENIDKDKYNVVAVYMDKKGDFYFSNDNLLIDSKNYKNIKSLLSKCENVYFVKDKNHTYLRNVHAGLFGSKLNQLIDIAFPVVHGTNVEDGNLQGYFHTLNLPVVGPDTLSAALSMDKYVMKEYCKAIGVPVIDALRFDRNDLKNADLIMHKVKNEIGFPVIVKPINLGSSIGIKKAKDEVGLSEAIELAFSFADIILIEKAITNLMWFLLFPFYLASIRECIFADFNQVDPCLCLLAILIATRHLHAPLVCNRIHATGHLQRLREAQVHRRRHIHRPRSAHLTQNRDRPIRRNPLPRHEVNRDAWLEIVLLISRLKLPLQPDQGHVVALDLTDKCHRDVAIRIHEILLVRRILRANSSH